MQDVEKTLQHQNSDGTLIDNSSSRDLDPTAPFDKLEKNSSFEVPAEPPVVSSEPPDGGLRAWLAVLGASCAAFSTFGYINAWGAFQSYYEENTLKDLSPSTIAWIGSLAYALIFIPGLVAGRLFDMGHMRVVVLIASIVLVASNLIVAQCTKYWHFLLVQGLLAGASCGFIFTPALSVISHWFKRRRGLAFGLLTMGAGIGGTTFPIAARRLILEVGFPWTMRIIAFVQVVTLAVSNLCLATRLPPRKNQGPFLTLRPFKTLSFSLYCLTELVVFLGLYTVLTYIDISATKSGISPDFSFYLVAIANAASSLGRIGGGLLGDRFGALNVMIPSTFVAGILTYAWPFARTEGEFIVIAVIYGLASGVFVCLLVAPLVDMGEGHEIGLRVGLSNTLVAIGGLTGPPISGAINSSTGGYKFVGVYAGSVVMLSVALMILTRHILIGRLWGKA